jgi:hypothetical protein
MTIESDGISFASEFQLSVLSIIGSGGVVVDLKAVVRELNLHEDLFSNTMTGSLLINDTQNLINVVHIIGAEYLSVVLIKPSTQFRIDKIFRIYKLSNRSKTTPHSEDYVLHFCSEELILSEAIKISKSYKNENAKKKI